VNEELPQVSDVLLSTSISLVNLAGIRLTGEQKDVPQAKEAIDAARALLPLCPEDQIGPIQDALSQVQMLYVRATQSPAQPAEPGAAAQQPEPDAADAEARAQARSKIWTPPGS
jgi:hypothetical protein